MRAALTILAVATITGASATFSGCLADLPEPSFIDDVRILAVRSEPPEVGAGDTVALEALVVDPFGRAITYAWYACIVVDEGQGFFGGGSETSTSGGNGTPLSTDPYGGSCQRRFEAGEKFAQSLGGQSTASLTIPADMFDTDEALKLAYSIPEGLEIPAEVKDGFLGIAGVNYTVSLVVEVEGRRIEAQKRVNVSVPSILPDNAANLNPSGLALHVAPKGDDAVPPTTGTPLTAGGCLSNELTFTSGASFTLTPLNIPDPQPKYVVLLAGTTTDAPFEIQTVDETSFYSFFATKGALTKPISKAPGAPSNTWKFADDDSGEADLWVVLRDGRGGIEFCHSRVTIGGNIVAEGTGGRQ